MSVNKVILIGHLGRDPEIRFMPSGDAMTSISVATTHTRRNADNEKSDITEWHRCVAFGSIADFIGSYLKSGRLVYIEGRLQTRKWTDNDGRVQYSTEVVINAIQPLGPRQAESAENASDSAYPVDPAY